MAMDDIFFGSEVWGYDSIRSHIWYTLPDSTTVNNYDKLKVYQRHFTWEYLRMLAKLLPLGYAWSFPLGEPGDY